MTIAEDGRISDVVDGVSPALARRAEATPARGPIAPTLNALIRDGARRLAGDDAPIDPDREPLAAAAYAECAGAGFTRLADVFHAEPDAIAAEASAIERAAHRAGVQVCAAPTYAADNPLETFMTGFGAFALERADGDRAWALGIDDLAHSPARTTLELSLAAAETRTGAPRHLLWPKTDHDVGGASAHIAALLSAATLGAHWALAGAGRAGAAGRAFNAAGGVLFGAAGPLIPRRLRGVEIDRDGPTCPAALLRATFGAPENADAATAIWRAAAVDAAEAVGCVRDGDLRVGARADFVVFDVDHPALAGASEDGVLDAFIRKADVRALRAVYAAGRLVAAYGRHRRADALAAAARDALWRAC